MRAAGYGDRIYGRALTSGGKTWLQYWLFSYYNPQNVLGFGVHEGDWEFVQLGLDADGVPDVATYAQHGGGERCAWSQVQKSGACRSCTSPSPRTPRTSRPASTRAGFYPDDYHRGTGYQVRPALEIVTPDHAVHGLAGQVGRLVVEPARAAAPEQVERAQLLQFGCVDMHGRRRAGDAPPRARCGRAPPSTSRRST